MLSPMFFASYVLPSGQGFPSTVWGRLVMGIASGYRPHDRTEFSCVTTSRQRSTADMSHGLLDGLGMPTGVRSM